METVKLTVAILATWRISAALYYGKEFGPLRERLTFALDADGVPLSFWGRQISCFWCVSFWVAWPVTILAELNLFGVLIPLALSGAVILLAGGSRILWREMMQ